MCICNRWFFCFVFVLFWGRGFCVVFCCVFGGFGGCLFVVDVFIFIIKKNCLFKTILKIEINNKDKSSTASWFFLKLMNSIIKYLPEKGVFLNCFCYELPSSMINRVIKTLPDPRTQHNDTWSNLRYMWYFCTLFTQESVFFYRRNVPANSVLNCHFADSLCFYWEYDARW